MVDGLRFYSSTLQVAVDAYIVEPFVNAFGLFASPIRLGSGASTLV
jgi:hypothetical protein